MKKVTLFCLALMACGVAVARGAPGGSHSVAGHVTKDGTYVAPHEATNPNGTKNDNWSTKGNTNPYTGKEGTKSPDSGAPSSAPKTPAPPKY